MTEQVLEDMRAWQSRPLDAVYPVILIDAIVLKVRSGQVANRPVYVAMGITVEGYRDVLGMWVGPTGGEGYGTSTGSWGRFPALTWGFTADRRVDDAHGANRRIMVSP